MGYKQSNDVVINATFSNSTVTSDAIDISHLEGVSFVGVFTGALAAGSMTVEVSNDNKVWIEDTSYSITITGPTVDFKQSATPLYAKYVRVVVESTDANSLGAQVTYNGKGI